DRLAELDARLRVLDAEVERPLGDAERLGRARRVEARSLVGRPAALREPHGPRGIDGRPVSIAGERHAHGLRLARDVREKRPRIEHVTRLLEQQRLLDEAETRLRDVEPAELLELAPAVVLVLPVAVE